MCPSHLCLPLDWWVLHDSVKFLHVLQVLDMCFLTHMTHISYVSCIPHFFHPSFIFFSLTLSGGIWGLLFHYNGWTPCVSQSSPNFSTSVFYLNTSSNAFVNSFKSTLQCSRVWIMWHGQIFLMVSWNPLVGLLHQWATIASWWSKIPLHVIISATMSFLDVEECFTIHHFSKIFLGWLCEDVCQFFQYILDGWSAMKSYPIPRKTLRGSDTQWLSNFYQNIKHDGRQSIEQSKH